MKWCCFLFWFVYRFILACLAHFNWSVALYTNCIYFTLWKSYDLLWFWMHLTLCSCFQSLRRENYMVVWSNLIWKRYTKYPDHTYKQLYFALYGGKGTRAERALERMDTIESREREQSRLRPEVDSSSSDDAENDVDESDERRRGSKITTCGPRAAISDVIAEEEAECRKYVYIGQAVDSHADLQSMRSEQHQREPLEIPNTVPVRPSRPSKETVANDTATVGAENQQIGNCSGNSVANGLGTPQNRVIFKDTVPVRPSIHRSVSEESKTSVWGRIVEKIQNPLRIKNKPKDSPNENAVDVLAPNYTNTYDVYDEKKLEKRARRDRKALTQRVRRRIREELREAARIERRRKKIADAIELLLQLLRMMTSFAVLVGNIRKTFIPAQFKYLKPGHHAYDHYELLLLFRVTTFLDVSMFWVNVMWVYCLQWHLFCRLGFLRFWVWLAILSTIAMVVMIAPMSYAMNNMDLSWCRFRPNSTLEKYQPKW
uniref:G_PROTEIN_RECEP_F1_2 domain-containing protein n=1 Tax=Haemonchus contortus TaxID=6289 RepID=A0A7I4XUH0_HAECO|nr:Protein F59F4.3 [Haemonchus contortus]